MAFDFYMPDIGEGVVEGEIVAWKVKEGDTVKLDQPLVEVMTDKATVELPSPRAGVIKKIHFKDGDICPVGKVLVVIEDDGSTATAGTNGNGHEAARSAPGHAPSSHAVHAAPAKSPVHGGGGGGIQVVDATAERARVLATPATRRLARQLGVEIGRVPATGKHGRVTTDDVRRYNDAPSPAQARPAASHAPISISKGGDEERIPLRGIRKKIAESMHRSVSTAAHFTYVEEVDMTELVNVRERAKARAAERGVKLNYLPFIVKSVVSGLKKWPMLNASLDESTQEIVRKKYYHIGIAAQGPQGLAVSVVRDADKRSIFELAQEIDRLSASRTTVTASPCGPCAAMPTW